jgi:hypothetical protein
MCEARLLKMKPEPTDLAKPDQSRARSSFTAVMPGLVPGIHVWDAASS